MPMYSGKAILRCLVLFHFYQARLSLLGTILPSPQCRDPLEQLLSYCGEGDKPPFPCSSAVAVPMLIPITEIAGIKLYFGHQREPMYSSTISKH